MSVAIINHLNDGKELEIYQDYKRTENEESVSTSHIWFINLMFELAAWMKSKRTNEVSILGGNSTKLECVSSLESVSNLSFDLCEGWEWVLSDLEEMEREQSLRESMKIREELGTLRNNSSLNFRSYFISLSSNKIEQLNGEEQSLLSYVLDPCKSSKILSDVIQLYKDVWLQFVKESIFQIKDGGVNNNQWESFVDSYDEKPYQRNLVGALKELAGAASLGRKDVGIDKKVMADILWSIWKTLSSSLRITLGRELSRYELTCLGNEIAKCQENIIALWIQTVKTSKSGTAKAGLVVKKWSEAKELEKKKMTEKILSCGVDAKWEKEKKNFQSEIDSYTKKSVKDIGRDLLPKLALFSPPQPKRVK
eukprot:TRINITY_DN1467_c0_g1_i1.p1 TRINITY_DN1467_c0_g1~~TRINITY_DN1467_c0_g1_i1.p1  ORF type:complete len:366 (+),score=113.87 TRINITY_DN1467_c0_g1_i1:184-1281(+)